MTQHINLNDNWLYSSRFQEQMIYRDYVEKGMESVRLPHTNMELPFHYFDEKLYQFVSCYRRALCASSDWEGKQVLLTFEGVAHVATVYLNGEKIRTHYGGYTAFTIDLAPYLKFGADNILAVEVDSRESCNLPPFGNVIDYLTYGGIYREVYLDIKETTYIADVFVMTNDTHNLNIRDDNQWKEVILQLSLQGAENRNNLQMRVSIENGELKSLYYYTLTVTGESLEHKFLVTGVTNWDIDQPVLYDLKLALYEDAGSEVPLDERTIRFGFRTCEFKKDGFYLNHKKVKLVGLNRHQSFPYVGYAMPKRMQQQDAEILKNELQVNAVRTSHYPQSKHFINRCDELGLLVFTEIPGWQHIGDELWKERACEQVREMVTQYRNHPSVILWGVRINESQDDDEFYKETNRIAHELDSSRQTGGVRYLKKSHLLEDVYTYNDFLHNGTTKGLDKKKEVTSDQKAPYLVSEFNGHMFPTKAFDDEEHRLEHALRHARVLDALFGQENIAGGFGWCMFDYNTHKDFGSGDKICYHGVMDMFRNPKLAAAVYASQNDRDIVCEISSSMDIGEHPAGNLGEVYAFTNADSIRLYKNDTLIKEYRPKNTKLPNLPHPPILLDDFVGDLLEKQEHFSHKTGEGFKKLLLAIKKYGPSNLPLSYKLKMAYLLVKNRIRMDKAVSLYYEYAGGWGGNVNSFQFEAVKNNVVKKVIVKQPVTKPVLEITVTATTLMEEETYDVAQVRIQAVDENGNRLYYYQEPVMLKAWGSVELMGPGIVSLRGGATGAYVKTKGVKGEGGLSILNEGQNETRICFTVV